MAHRRRGDAGADRRAVGLGRRCSAGPRLNDDGTSYRPPVRRLIPLLMRPRIAFAMLLALCAGTHLVLLVSPPRSFGYLAFYLCWLLPSAVYAWFLWAASSASRPLSVRERRTRPASSGLWMEGLGLFVGIAAVGLVIHLLGPYKAVYRPSKSVWSQSTALSLMFILSAAGCWGLLRGAPGDSTAPIPDGSRLVRAGGWLRRMAGVGIACWGAWLLVLGIREWGQSADGIDRMLNLAFVVGGPMFLLIGLALALRRGRSAS